jgi:dUTP pyrophosphatase
MQVKMKKLREDAVTPTYSTPGSACFDLSVPTDEGDRHSGIGTLAVDTGLAFEVPEGFAMLVFSRSGQGFKSNTRLANCVGIIDSDYRGQLKVKLTRDDDGPLVVKAGDKIAQALVLPVEQVQFLLVDELSDTERGEQGFGSTELRGMA